MKALKCPTGGGFGLGLMLLCSIARNDAAGPLIYQATGTREQIQPVIDQFKHDIIYGVGGNDSVVGSVKLVTFEDVSAGSNKTIESVGEGKSNGIPLPVLPGHRFSVSAGTADPEDPNRLFGDIHPSYLDEFAPFSSPSLLAVRDPNSGPGMSFIFAGHVYDPFKAFGAVFVDVDSPGSAYIRVSSMVPPETLEFDVPADPGHANFSFLGLLMDAGETFAPGSIGVALPLLSSTGEDASNDMVTVDDFIYGLVIPEPSAMLLGLFGGLLTWITLRFRHRKLTDEKSDSCGYAKARL